MDDNAQKKPHQAERNVSGPGGVHALQRSGAATTPRHVRSPRPNILAACEANNVIDNGKQNEQRMKVESQSDNCKKKENRLCVSTTLT